MSLFSNPFDANSRLACGCGRHASQAEHERATQSVSQGDAASSAVEQAVMRALFPQDALRRRFLRAVGSGTAMAAIASIFPLAAAKEAFAQTAGPLEKQKLKVGFIPITCATPIIMAHPMGFYGKQGLDVEVVKTAGWALIRDKA
ncbi:MAG: ABC transporter substrate-binding protein, partial [Achromobacter mucicolens]